MNTFFAVVLAGGSGTRFWPLSREKTPKQLLPIAGDDTLLQQTVKRILPLIPREDVFVVTHPSLFADVSAQLSERFGESWDQNIVTEPEARNTAPALGLAALHLQRLAPDSCMVVLSTDHVIRRGDLLPALLTKARDAAGRGHIVTIGIRPAWAETAYGYIRAGAACPGEDATGARRVEAFVEKPDLQTAEGYLGHGGYYWNSGIFVWKTATLLEEIKKYAPKLHGALEEIRASLGTEREDQVIKDVFSRLEPISIDYAVMERTERAAVIPAEIGWADVGSWAALEQVSQRDSAGNVITGNVIDIDSKGSIVHAEKRLVATVGLDGVVVVDTPDAVLVCSKDRVQDVKEVVEQLRQRKGSEHLVHRTVHRPWGSYTVLEEAEHYKIKRITVRPGGRLSLQMHRHRSEHWVVVSGTATVTNGDKVYDVHPNEGTYIPMTTRHRLENHGRIPLQIIEVQNGEYLEEDDIVRFEDDYHRTEKTRPWLPKVEPRKS
ncbi:MAG TPA: mannose-1-phosphate guanylyltransferase/mannose-6-phosphate isomerase [Myxococcales bacterium]|jgi:mannose-1-phosphate guanylyltransferase/mannose-6-phosphate isomerase